MGNGQEVDHGKLSRVEITEPFADSASDDLEDDPLIDFFEREEIRKYIKVSGSPLPRPQYYLPLQHPTNCSFRIEFIK